MDNKDMLKEALSIYGKPLGQLLKALAGEDGDTWFTEFKKFLRREPCWEKTPASEMMRLARKSTELLKFYGTASTPATTEKFVAKEKFIVNTSDEAEVNISYVGPTFQKEFLDDEGIIDEPHPATILCRYKLRHGSVDKPIMADRGDHEPTTLSEIFALMKKQRRGQRGKLLTNGWANIFYVRSRSGVLFAVRVNWDGDGWDVEADSVENPLEWNAGHLVFSRDSALKPSDPASVSEVTPESNPEPVTPV